MFVPRCVTLPHPERRTSHVHGDRIRDREEKCERISRTFQGWLPRKKGTYAAVAMTRRDKNRGKMMSRERRESRVTEGKIRRSWLSSSLYATLARARAHDGAARSKQRVARVLRTRRRPRRSGEKKSERDGERKGKYLGYSRTLN